MGYTTKKEKRKAKCLCVLCHWLKSIGILGHKYQNPTKEFDSKKINQSLKMLNDIEKDRYKHH